MQDRKINAIINYALEGFGVSEAPKTKAVPPPTELAELYLSVASSVKSRPSSFRVTVRLHSHRSNCAGGVICELNSSLQYQMATRLDDKLRA